MRSLIFVGFLINLLMLVYVIISGKQLKQVKKRKHVCAWLCHQLVRWSIGQSVIVEF